LLAKAAARGGNILMNIGPMGSGQVDPKDVAILQGIGAWWSVNGESIRGTTRTPLPVQAWGESTRKGNTIYLHVFDWPRDGRLVVGGLKTEVKQAWLLADRANTNSTQLKVVRMNPLDVRVEGLPQNATDPNDSVVVLDCAGEPQADPARLLTTSVAVDTLRAFDAQLVGPLQFGPGKTSVSFVKNWTRQDETIMWPVRLNEKATFEATLVYDAPTDTVRNRMVEGDAGKELVRAGKGAGGTYQLALGPQTFTQPVKSGLNVKAALGRVTLPPGNYEFRISAKEILGEELFRVSRLELKTIKE
jgi:hypothetical protein